MSLKFTGQNPGTALSSFFRALLTEKIVDSLLVPQEVSSKNSVVSTLVKEAGRIEAVAPLAPVSLANAARHVSDLTFTDPEEKIGVVLRPCEARALVELVKLNQASLDHLLLIGVDCLGTFNPTDYARMAGENLLTQDGWINQASNGETIGTGNVTIRQCCRTCDQIVPENVDLTIGWVGVNEQFVISMPDEIASMLKEKLALEEKEMPAERLDLVARLKENRAAEKERVFQEFDRKFDNIEALTAELATCLRCQNCRRACPLCFCRQCVFEGPVFDHESEKYIKWASRKGIIEMPTDTVLFHLTRLNHMGMSCVGCGQCESACPSELPVSTIFRAVGKKVQDLFDYVPGKDIEEKLPLTTYKEVELEPR